MASAPSTVCSTNSRPIRTGAISSSSTSTSTAIPAPGSAPATRRDGPDSWRSSFSRAGNEELGAEPGVTLSWGREVCGRLVVAESREWLCTNGIGGFASGTVAGVLTRRYHGLFVAALTPPLGRTLLVSKLDETLEYDTARQPLFSNRWGDGNVDPHGYVELESFRLDGTTPVWTFASADALGEQR